MGPDDNHLKLATTFRNQTEEVCNCDDEETTTPLPPIRGPEIAPQIYVDIPDGETGFAVEQDVDIYDYKWNTETQQFEPMKVYQKETDQIYKKTKLLVVASNCGCNKALLELKNKIGSKDCFQDNDIKACITVSVLQPAKDAKSLQGLQLMYTFNKFQISGQVFDQAQNTVIESVVGFNFHISMQNIENTGDYIGPGRNAYRIEIPSQYFAASKPDKIDGYKAYVHVDEDVLPLGKIVTGDPLQVSLPIGQTFQLVLDTGITEKSSYFDYNDGFALYADSEGTPFAIMLPSITSGKICIDSKSEYPGVIVRPVLTREYTQDETTGKFVTDDTKKILSYKLFVTFLNSVPFDTLKSVAVKTPQQRAKVTCLSRFPK